MDYTDDIKKVNMTVDSLKKKVDMYASIGNLKNRDLKTPLKGLVHSSAPGKKVTKIGVFLLWFPEPTQISNIVGVPMIAAGKLLDRYYTGTTIKHVGEEARKTLESLGNVFK